MDKLPNVYFGEISESEEFPELEDDLDDDELEETTPRSVVEILGFDPLDLDNDELELGSDKLPTVNKDKAKYTDDSTTPQHCSLCSMFLPPSSCDTVIGTISPKGWCTYFKWKDQEKDQTIEL